MAEATDTIDSYRSPDEIERDPQGVVRRWTTELDLAHKRDKDWLDEAKKIQSKYEAEKQAANSFNMLWANTRIMRPAIYNSVPKPDVRRRYRDKDPLGKAASKVLERALDYSLDSYDFDGRMKDCTLDTLLPGRGVLRVYYDFESHTEEEQDTDDDGAPLVEDGKPVMRTYDTITNESATCQFVQHDDFRHGFGKRWEKVPWVAFRHRMRRHELEKKFGKEIAKAVPLDDVDSDYGDKEIRELFKTAEVWEIWDKVTRKVRFICTAYKKGPLKEFDDPLRLKDFFPTPKPLYAIDSTRTLVPIPIYRLYEKQAEEIDLITTRINKIVGALKIRGAYASHMPELAAILEADDTTLIPITSLSEMISSAGGLEKFIWLMPLEKLAQALRYLYEARNEAKQVIYEIIGLSDILRGSTNPNETKGAQVLKSQWGSLSLQDLQKEVQRYARDIIRLKAEIIAEHFQLSTLQAMTDMKLPSAEDKRAAVAEIQRAQGQPPPKEALEAAQAPSWEEVYELLHSEEMRCYKIDIETDSTVAEQVAGDVEGLTEVISGVVNVINGFAPAVESGAVPVQAVKDILMAVVRRARLGSVVEDAIEDMGEPQQQPQAPQEAPKQAGTDPAVEMQKMQMEHQLETQRLQIENGELQLENQRMQIEMGRFQLERAETAADIRNTDADTGLKNAQTVKTQREAQMPVAIPNR